MFACGGFPFCEIGVSGFSRKADNPFLFIQGKSWNSLVRGNLRLVSFLLKKRRN